MGLQQIQTHLKLPDFTVSTAHFSLAIRFACLAVMLNQGSWSVGQDAGNKISSESRLFANLSVPMTSIVDGRSFRDGMTRLCESVEVNLWIDREVDPSRTIDSGRLGPTAYMAIKKLAADHGCVAMPVRSVVLVGKEEWVDHVSACLISVAVGERVNVSWPRLTTPKEARAIVTKLAPKTVPGQFKPLSHDLWPAVEWSGIESTVANALIGLQMDRSPHINVRDRGWAAKLRLGYDRKSSKAAERIKKRDPLESKFSLTTKTRAGDVLRQLCAAAGRPCVIENDAAVACQSIVSVNETDVSLRTLIEIVARQAGAQVTWKDDRTVVSIKK